MLSYNFFRLFILILSRPIMKNNSLPFYLLYLFLSRKLSPLTPSIFHIYNKCNKVANDQIYVMSGYYSTHHTVFSHSLNLYQSKMIL